MKHNMTKSEIEAAIAKAPKTTAQMMANRKAFLAKLAAKKEV